MESESEPEVSTSTEPIKPDKPIDLFNGKDLENWTYDIGNKDNPTDPASVYRVEDGIIKNAGRPSGVMRTKQAYRDYEIEVQWRWPGKGGNSGLLIHSSRPRERNVWPKSIEVQLASQNAGDFWVIGEKVRVKDAEKQRALEQEGRDDAAAGNRAVGTPLGDQA